MKNNTKNYTWTRLGFLALVVLFAWQCDNTPPADGDEGIIIDDVDTMSFSIVTDDADTMSFMIVTPVVKKNGQIEKSSIVIDNVDMTRMIMNKETPASFQLDVQERKKKEEMPQQQAQ